MGKTINAHFSVDGHFLADFARTRMREGNYQHALRVLDCLDGLGLEEQVNILRGKKTLTGVDSEISLINESPDITQAIEDWHTANYGSLFMFHERIFKPYAYVKSWSRNDLPRQDQHFSYLAKQFTDEFEPELLQKITKNPWSDWLGEHPHSRSLHYADSPERDLALTVTNIPEPDNFGYPIVVLFKELTEQIPFWAQSYYAKNPREAVLRAFQYNIGLRREGAEYYSDDIVREFLPTDDPHGFIVDNTHEEKKNAFVRDQSALYDEDGYWARREQAIEDIKKQIIDYANNDKEYGWNTLVDEDGNTLKVPGRAFLHFSVERAEYTDKNLEAINLPEYKAFSPRGLKMMNDDNLHTDCWLGAGLSLDSAYDHESWQHKLFFNKMFECQSAFSPDYDFNILHKGKQAAIKGTTVNIENYAEVPKGSRILVLPHLGVEFETVALQFDAIITKTGGKLAHLVTVGREFGIPIIRMENAVIRFALPQEYIIGLNDGTIQKITNKNKNKPKA